MMEKQQEQIMKDLIQQIEKLVHRENIANAMREEENDFAMEQKKIRKREINEKMDNFLSGRLQEHDIIKYIME